MVSDLFELNVAARLQKHESPRYWPVVKGILSKENILINKVSIMAADDLVGQGARASTATVYPLSPEYSSRRKIYKSHQSKQRIFNILSLKASFMWPTWGHLGPTGPSWAPCWPHEPCYLGRHGYYSLVKRTLRRIYSAIKACAVSKRTLHWIMVVDPLTISVNNRLRSVYYW